MHAIGILKDLVRSIPARKNYVEIESYKNPMFFLKEASFFFAHTATRYLKASDF
jgi:hypothetical protein